MVVALLVVVLLCLLRVQVAAAAVPQLTIPRFLHLPAVPNPLIVPNYTTLAGAFVASVWNASGVGPCLPIAWNDTTAFNFDEWVLALPSYVGGVNGSATPDGEVPAARHVLTPASPVAWPAAPEVALQCRSRLTSSDPLAPTLPLSWDDSSP
jgi:hypothetical protein